MKLCILHRCVPFVLVFLGNTHILWGDLMKPVTQVCEIALVTQALHNAVTSLKSQGELVAYILCGDFNIDPNYPAYELMKEGKLNDDELAKLRTVDYLNFSSDCEKPKQVSKEVYHCISTAWHSNIN